MNYLATDIAGAFVIEMVPHHDHRGHFARAYCAGEFAEHGLDLTVSQCDVSVNRVRGTLRGMHSQRAPRAQSKLVRCTQGAIHDVIVDLRADSPSYLRHVAVDLTAANRLSIYVPKGVFHGFLTLADETEVFYQMSDPYVADAGVGYRWNDPAFGIQWPDTVVVISQRDAAYPDFA